MKGWQELRIKDVAIVNELTIDNNYPYENIEYIDISSVEEGRIKEKQKLTVDNAPSRAKRILRENDTIISTVRPNLKHYCFIKECNENTIASTGYAVITPQNIHPYFLYCLLTTKEYTDYLSKIAEGHTSAYPSLNPDVIENSKFLIPNLKEQKAIADILSSLDDKIELLQKQNKTLEDIAKALFKRWFVNFEFPNERGKPYKSSGGKMVESELVEIPEGWKVKPLSEFGQIICGKTPSKSKQDFFGGEIPFIKIPDMQTQLFLINSEDSLTSIGADTQQNKYIPEDSICVSCIATVGLVGITTKKSQTNQQINSIIPMSKIYREYLYLSMVNLSSFLNAIGSGGTATLNINTGIFSNLKILYPNSEIINSFNSVSSPLFNKIKSNSMQMDMLCKCRNVILPKLMGGEVRVEDFKN